MRGWLGGAAGPEDLGVGCAVLGAGATGVVSAGRLAATGAALWQAAVVRTTAKPNRAKVAFFIGSSFYLILFVIKALH